MSYVQSILGQGEQILLLAKMHWINYVRAIILAVLALLVAGFGLIAITVIALVVAGLILLLSAIAFVRIYLNVSSTELAVTNQRVIYKTGILKRHTMEQQLNRIDSVSVDQTYLGRMLGYGEVDIRGSGNSFTPTHKIAHPLEFRKAVQTGINDVATAANNRDRI
jgi:uncharacterized membrane protein YdbT with pleckstrin-like domain